MTEEGKTMSDYIKREDAIRSIADHDEFKGERWIKEAWADYLIEDAKPADVAQVRHGRWIKDDVFGIPVYRCSACDKEFWLSADDTPQGSSYRYCPNCGARMDGDGNEID